MTRTGAATACAAIALAGAVEPCAVRAEAVPHAPRQVVAGAAVESEAVGDFRAIRAAEASSDTARIEGLLRLAGASPASDPSGVVALRARNALDAVARRQAATTAAELAEAEDAVESARAALLARLRGETRDAARALEAELLLESAEDLLLRRLAANATDAMLAAGLPSDAELDAALRISTIVRARLADPALDGPGDEARLFRARVLRGLSALLEHDLARLDPHGHPDGAADAARARAHAALDEAALSSIAAPGALAEMLALAEARTTTDPARRATLLATAARSQDAATAFVARLELWRDGGLRGDAPRTGSGTDLLAQLSLAAEVRAHTDAGSDAAAVVAAIERWIDRAGRGAIEVAALRTARAVAMLPVAATSPPTLTALHLLLRRDAAAPLPREALLAAARDARVGPAVALRVAETLLRTGDADGAATLILDSLERFDALPSARGALEIALEVRRLRALSAVSTRNAAADGADPPEDAALSEALRLACRRFEGDSGAPIWRIELEFIEDAGAAVETRPFEAGDAAPPWLVRALAAREELIAAESARTGGGARGATAAVVRLEGALAMLAPSTESVAGHTHAERRVALLAARRWLDLAASSDTGREAPAALGSLASASPAVGAHARALLSTLVDRAADALDRKRPREDSAPIRATLGTFAALADAAARAKGDDGAGATARAFRELLAGDHAAAVRAARDALARATDERPRLWVLAEALRGTGTREALDEAFSCFRALAPITARERDDWWWRGQLGQLEVLAASDSAHESTRADIVARVNQLLALDQGLGGEALRARFETLRARAEALRAPAETQRTPAAEPRPGEPTGEAP